MKGNGGNDALTGGGDVISGGAGNDTINGGDKITGDAGNDTINGDEGDNTIDGGLDDDTVSGGMGIDSLTGGLGHNTINGGDGDDTIVSAVGAVDTVDGEAGEDVWRGDYSARSGGMTLSWDGSLQISDGTTVANVERVNIVLGGGDDLVSAAGATTNAFNVAAGAGDDVIDFSLAVSGVNVSLNSGGGGSLRISGFENVIGSAFDDVLSGDGGANVITGGAGADVLTGGGGGDRFAFASLSDLGTSSNINQIDRLTDFTHFEGDRIDLSAIDADPNTDGDQAFVFIGSRRFGAGGTGQAELRYSQSVDGYLLVQGDLNHDGNADFSFLVRNTALVASDLVL